MPSQKNKAARKAHRREDVPLRQAYWDRLTPAEKLARLDARPGASRKERLKLEHV